MKILITGDSFAADWTSKYKGIGWPNMLAEKYFVTNLAQAGCSEYKIFLQLSSINFKDYDTIIVSHTSPNRIYIESHPVHKNDPLHKNSDLIYTDLKEHSKSNKSLLPIIEYYEKYFSFEYALFVHNLICEKIDTLLKDYTGNLIHTSLDWTGCYKFNNMLSFEHLFLSNRGLMNHHDEEGNKIIYNELLKFLNQ